MVDGVAGVERSENPGSLPLAHLFREGVAGVERSEYPGAEKGTRTNGTYIGSKLAEKGTRTFFGRGKGDADEWHLRRKPLFTMHLRNQNGVVCGQPFEQGVWDLGGWITAPEKQPPRLSRRTLAATPS